MTEAIPNISVVMIFWNAARHIEEAIASVFAQTHESWELLLVDDGSTDASSGIARAMADRHPGRVRYLEHPGHCNAGMSASRNLGIAHARGAYLAFLDSDDLWLPERLARHLGVLQAHLDVAMVYGPTFYWFGWTGRPGDARRDFVPPLHVATHVPLQPPLLMEAFLRSGGAALPGICSLLVRMEAVKAVGGFDPTFRSAFEDQVFLSKIALSCPVIVIDEWLDKYRQHAASYSAQAIASREYDPSRPNPARLRFLEWLESHLAGMPDRQRRLGALLERELRPYRQPRRHALLSAPRYTLSNIARRARQLRYRVSS